MALSGYSGTSLAKKLGIKPDSRLLVVNAPANYSSFFTDFPVGIDISTFDHLDIIHYFEKDATRLEATLLHLKTLIVQNGMIWVSWPKKASGIKTGITEDIIRETALRNELVDVKVCAVNETWSGLKLVIPLKRRKSISAVEKRGS